MVDTFYEVWCRYADGSSHKADEHGTEESAKAWIRSHRQELPKGAYYYVCKREVDLSEPKRTPCGHNWPLGFDPECDTCLAERERMNDTQHGTKATFADSRQSYQFKQASIAKALFLHKYPMEDWHSQHPFTIDAYFDQAAVALNALGINP